MIFPSERKMCKNISRIKRLFKPIVAGAIVALSTSAYSQANCENHGYIEREDNFFAPNSDKPAGYEKVIGVTFYAYGSDRSQAQANQEASQLRCLLNQPGYDRDGNFGSVRDYFMRVSGGKFDFRSYVIPVRLPKRMEDYQEAAYKKKNVYDFDFSGNSLDGIAFKNIGPTNDFIVKVLAQSSARQFFEDMKAGANGTLPLTEKIQKVKVPRLPIQKIEDAQELGVGPDLDLYVNHYRSISIVFEGKIHEDTQHIDGLWPSAKPYSLNDQGDESNLVRLSTSPQQALQRETAVGSVHIQAFNVYSETAPTIGTMVHEKGHQLFQWKDLYEFNKRGEGIGQHSLMGSNFQKVPQWPNPYYRDQLGWGEIYDISEFPTGALPPGFSFSLSANSGTAWKYCNPRSYTNECFYIEARKKQRADDPIPSEGLIIWHTEDSEQADADINSFPVTFDFAGMPELDHQKYLHNAISVVQADNNYDLDRRVNEGDAGDAFGAHTGAFEFSDNTLPSARWWDGSRSGFNITNISAPNSSGSVFFEFGERPSYPIYYAGLVGVTLNSPIQSNNAGKRTTVDFTLEAGYEIEAIHVNGVPLNDGGFTNNALSFWMPSEEVDVVFFTKRVGESVKYKSIYFYTQPGANIIAYTKNGPVSIGLDNYKRYPANKHLGYPCEEKAVLNCNESDDRTHLVRAFRVVASEGYNIENVNVTQRRNPSITQQSPLYSIPFHDSNLAFNYWKIFARARPIKNFYCDGSVPEWDPVNIDGDDTNNYIYKRIGTTVRHNDVIYRNMIMNNPTVYRVESDSPNEITPGTPESRHSWLPIAHCDASPQAEVDCSASDVIDIMYHSWGDATFGASNGLKVRYMGNLYELDVQKPSGYNQQAGSLPGSFHLEHTRFASEGLSQYFMGEDIDMLQSLHLFSLVDPIVRAGLVDVIEMPYFETRSDWKLIGRCRSGTDPFPPFNPTF